MSNHHIDASTGWLRAAVFGAMDGMVTNIAMVAGLAGGGADRSAIILAGSASLVAGAVSMGMGEYTSVKTQNEQTDAEVAKERTELDTYPQAEFDELSEALVGIGFSRDLALSIASETLNRPDLALRLHTITELGIVYDEAPHPSVAAVSSFMCFALGAAIPLISYLAGYDSLFIAVLVSSVGLFCAGSIVTRVTAGNWFLCGMRQLILGLTAALITYIVGLGLGTIVS